MKQLLEYIIPNIVNNPEEVVIKEDNQNGLITLTIQTNPEDIGRVIGKSGKVIKAIRQIARIIAIKQGVRVNIDVLDSTSGVKESQEDPTSEAAETQEDDLALEEPVIEEEIASDETEEEGIELQTE